MQWKQNFHLLTMDYFYKKSKGLINKTLPAHLHLISTFSKMFYPSIKSWSDISELYKSNCVDEICYSWITAKNDISGIEWKQNRVINSSSLCSICASMHIDDTNISRLTASSWPLWPQDRTPINFWFWFYYKCNLSTTGS